MTADNEQGESFEEYFGEVPEDNLRVIEVAFYAEKAWDNRTQHYEAKLAEKDGYIEGCEVLEGMQKERIAGLEGQIQQLSSIIIQGSAAVLQAKFEITDDDDLSETFRLIACKMIDDRKRAVFPTDKPNTEEPQ